MQTVVRNPILVFLVSCADSSHNGGRGIINNHIMQETHGSAQKSIRHKGFLEARLLPTYQWCLKLVRCGCWYQLHSIAVGQHAELHRTPRAWPLAHKSSQSPNPTFQSFSGVLREKKITFVQQPLNMSKWTSLTQLLQAIHSISHRTQSVHLLALPFPASNRSKERMLRGYQSFLC